MSESYEQFLMDMIEQPAWAECLLDRIAEQNFIRAVAFAKAGVDWIVCGDDVANQKAMMFAPETWRKMMLSRWKKVWQAVKVHAVKCVLESCVCRAARGKSYHAGNRGSKFFRIPDVHRESFLG